MRITAFYIALFSILSTHAQPAISTLRVNGLRAAINANGLLFDSMGNPAFNTAAGLMLASRAGIWISAKDSTGKLIVSKHDLLGNSHEFSAGPLVPSTGQAPDPALWNKVYPISAKDISYHRSHYKNSGYVASSNILNWPGSVGPPYAQIMAPFVDLEVNDMIYQPLQGDYPYISSDALIYSISNDAYGNPAPLGMEIHTSLYGFDQKDTVLKNCVLVRYTVHNRSGHNYDNFRLSSAIHFRIGTLENEFLGTDARNKALFAVNDTSEATFSNQLVSMGCMIINRTLSSTMYFNDNADPISGRPLIDSDFYNLMQGRWKSGKQLSYFSNGVDCSIPARYVYPYTTDASHGDSLWSEESTLNLAGSRFGILNTDSMVLKNGQAAAYDFVYFFVEKNNYDIKHISDFCLSMKRALADKNLLKIPSHSSKKAAVAGCFPNPVKGGEKVRITNVPETASELRLVGMDGQEICKLDLDINDNCIILPLYLSGGMYMIECKTLNTAHYIKLIVNN